MKNFGPLFFLIALIWSWHLVHSTSSVPFSTHMNLQTEFSELIVKSIQSRKPESKNIQIQEVWTESLNSEQVKLHVTYSFELPSDNESWSRSEISAEALLQKESQDDQGQKWKLIEFTPNRDEIIFSEGLLITPGAIESDKAETNQNLDSNQQTTQPTSEKNENHSLPELSQ